MDSDSITISRARLTDDVSRGLIGALNAELSATYPEPGATHFGLDEAEVSEGRGAFLVASLDGEPVGCGAVRLLDAETGELKRMYVSPAARGRGVGRALVAALEAEARAIGARRLVLETGTRQTAAIALYLATGFTPIPLYGEYVRSPNTSVCLGKDLGGDDQGGGGSVSQNKQTVARYLDGFRASDHAMVLSCLTDDVEWHIPGAFHVTGKDAFDREIENDAFVGSPTITLIRMVEEHDVVVAEGEVRSQRRDGGQLHAVFCDVFEMHGGLIARLTSYLAVLS